MENIFDKIIFIIIFGLAAWWIRSAMYSVIYKATKDALHNYEKGD
jgi:ABC-type nickel/cobalt efflux system permease component RcnA